MEEETLSAHLQRHTHRGNRDSMFLEEKMTRVRDGRLRKAVRNCPGPSTPAIGGRLQNMAMDSCALIKR